MPHSYSDIINLIQDDFKAVDSTIRGNLNSEVALINTLAEYVIASGGKRLRPMLTILAGKAINDQFNPKLHIAAAVVEYIHTATLIHDDVVDDSDQRRGKKTANNVWGNEAAVLVGDFLYSRAFQLMQQLDSLPIQNIFADTTNTIAEGEVIQLLNIGNLEMTEEDYFSIIESKTAVLFSAACKVGAMISGGTKDQIEALGEYGRNLGIAFQLMDDILDYEGTPEELGKNLGDDLNEGKLTLPLIHAIKNNKIPKKALEIFRDCQEGTQKLKPTDLELFNSLINSCGSIEYCNQLLYSHSNKAIESIRMEQLSHSILTDLARISLTRKN